VHSQLAVLVLSTSEAELGEQNSEM
jgi:hypothetical protein